MVVFEARVKTNQPEFSVKRKGSSMEICVKGKAEDNKANMEIVRELRRLTGRDVSIIKGLKSKRKLIAVEGLTEKEFEETT